MAVLLSPGTYGAQTDQLQKILAAGAGLSLLTPHPPPDVTTTTQIVTSHWTALSGFVHDVAPFSAVRILGGDVDAFRLVWAEGRSWRERMGHLVGELQDRRAGTPGLVPPIWPIGLVNVLGVVVVATDQARESCGRISATQEEQDACWECLCFAEQVVDALLIATLSQDPAIAIFSPLLELMAKGQIPIGLENGIFSTFAFGPPRTTLSETRMRLGPIQRQSESTIITELTGHRCSSFFGIRSESGSGFELLFLEAEGIWHRFYLDAGLLFWEETEGPDPEEDLLEGERYIDLASALRVAGVEISEVRMSDNRFLLQFENGARLLLEHPPRADSTEVLEMTPGAPAPDPDKP